MPCLKNPVAEEKRIATVRAALVLSRPWEHSTGPRTAEGRAVQGHVLRHGLDSLAVKWALGYVAAIERALSNK